MRPPDPDWQLRTQESSDAVASEDLPIHSTRRGPGNEHWAVSLAHQVPGKFPPSCRQMRAGGGPRNRHCGDRQDRRNDANCCRRSSIAVDGLAADQVAVPVSRTNGWKIAYSPNMPASMSGTEGNWYFDFPSRNGVHYVYKLAPAIKVGQTITMHFAISGNATFVPTEGTATARVRSSSNSGAIPSRRRSRISAGGAYLMLNCVRESLR